MNPALREALGSDVEAQPHLIAIPLRAIRAVAYPAMSRTLLPATGLTARSRVDEPRAGSATEAKSRILRVLACTLVYALLTSAPRPF